MDVVLVHPEIPHNSGCTARLCAATGATLHLVRPLGFTLEDRYLKRAGLDYWPDVDMVVHEDWSALETWLGRDAETPFAARLRLFSARGGTSIFETPFMSDDILVFGSETKGLPQAVFAEEARGASRVYIPIRDCVRSLNLANVVCLALYTAMHRAGVPLPDNDGNYVAKERARKLRPDDVARPSHRPESGAP